MNMSYMRMCAALLVFSASCARTESASDTTAAAAAPASDASVAAGVSNAIAANPAAADSILRANGYTAETFERAMYEIAQDSAQSAAYAAARSQ
jgi:hypothetical protein